MPWQVKGDDDNMMVLDGVRVVGSVVRSGGHAAGWHVEVLWSGPGGDITYSAPTLMMARAFLRGVEETMVRAAAAG